MYICTMGNLIQVDKFHCDEISEQANDFINKYRGKWNNFIINARLAVENGDQDRLNEAINRLAPYLDKEGGKQLWEELWTWVVLSNRGKWKNKKANEIQEKD